jgi:integral membrane protein (TIGR01906 family)
MKLINFLKSAAAVLFVLSLPVLFCTTTLRWLVSDTGWYQGGFAKYGVSARTGISTQDLARSAEQISSYLLVKQNSLDIPVQIAGAIQPLFKERELLHMRDVRNLLNNFYVLQGISALYALLYLGLSPRWLRGNYLRSIGKKLQWGGGLTLGLFGGFGILSMFSFDSMFLEFHMLSFDNDLWILDPTKDNLIMMFPQGFWYDSAVRLAMVTGAEALGALIVGGFMTTKR